MWVNFPPILHYSKGKKESESKDAKKKIGVRIPMQERENKALLTMCALRGRCPVWDLTHPCSGGKQGKQPKLNYFSVLLAVILESRHSHMCQENSPASAVWRDKMSFRSPKQLFSCIEEAEQLKWLHVESSVCSSSPSTPHPYKQGNCSGMFVSCCLNQTK